MGVAFRCSLRSRALTFCAETSPARGCRGVFMFVVSESAGMVARTRLLDIMVLLCLLVVRGGRIRRLEIDRSFLRYFLVSINGQSGPEARSTYLRI